MMLGKLLEIGDSSVRQGDLVQAERYYTVAALQGNAYAQAELALVHCNLRGRYLKQKKIEEGEVYYKECADQGKLKGAQELVMLYKKERESPRALAVG